VEKHVKMAPSSFYITRTRPSSRPTTHPQHSEARKLSVTESDPKTIGELETAGPIELPLNRDERTHLTNKLILKRGKAMTDRKFTN